MEKDNLLRQQLIALLNSSDAHANFERAIENMPAALSGKKLNGAAHSIWEVLEHMRITQRDILESLRKPDHVSPEFPAGYWPDTHKPPNDAACAESADAFRADFKAVTDLLQAKTTDPFAPIRPGDSRTALQMMLTLADHNAYHLGEMVVLRRLLGVWDSP